MKFWTKKRTAAVGLAAVMTLSLAACGEKAPSLEEVEQAIEAGTQMCIRDRKISAVYVCHWRVRSVECTW